MAQRRNGQPQDWPRRVDFAPATHPLLPVEVSTLGELRGRADTTDLSIRQRATFNQLVLCFEGSGVTHVDLEPIALRPGTLLHIHPGQVQEFHTKPDLDAFLITYRAGLDRPFIPGREWFPGSDVPSLWELTDGERNAAGRLVGLLQKEQHLFDGSAPYIVFMESLLSTLIARLHLSVGEAPPSQMPEAFIVFGRYLDANLQTRPTVTKCAAELGYSTRTLDRACQLAVSQTAKQVLDERMALEAYRMLRYTSLSSSEVGRGLGFRDDSSFSRFVRRHYSASPTELRSLQAPVERVPVDRAPTR